MNKFGSTTTTVATNSNNGSNNSNNNNIPSFLTVPPLLTTTTTTTSSRVYHQQEQQQITSLSESNLLLEPITKVIGELKGQGLLSDGESTEMNNTISFIKTSFPHYLELESKMDRNVIVPSDSSNIPHGSICYIILVRTINQLSTQLFSLLNNLKLHTLSSSNSASNTTLVVANLLKNDSLLKLSVDQLLSLFPLKSSSSSSQFDTTSILPDDAREFWLKSFGSGNVALIPWSKFFTVLQTYHLRDISSYESSWRHILDFTQDGYISTYKFSIFLKWFGPLENSIPNLVDIINSKIMSGFISGVESSKLLEKKSGGSYIIRFSKTSPGSFAVTFVDNSFHIRHCLLYPVIGGGLTLQQPPDIYKNLTEFVMKFSSKLKYAIGPIDASLLPPENVNIIITETTHNHYLNNNTNTNIDGALTPPTIQISPSSSSSGIPISSPLSSSPLSTSPLSTSPNQTTTTTRDINRSHSPSRDKSPSKRRTSKSKQYEQTEIPDNNLITKDICIVCMDNAINTVFLECGHLSCCSECSTKLKLCPLCRKHITRVITIFRPNQD